VARCSANAARLGAPDLLRSLLVLGFGDPLDRAQPGVPPGGGVGHGLDRCLQTGSSTRPATGSTSPTCPASLLSAEGRELPLYRRIVPPELRGLHFAGFVDAPGGLLPVVETQGEWIAAAITGRLRLPPTTRMWQAIEQAEPCTRERFPDESPRSVRCDPHAYRRLLHADLRRARRKAVIRSGRVLTLAKAVSLSKVRARARIADSA
jgi:hypothetical protein